jgi:hypothetical protein
VVITEWKEFRQLNLLRLLQVMRSPVLVDGRNLYDPAEMARLGFRYRGIGRPEEHDTSPLNGHRGRVDAPLVATATADGNGHSAASRPRHATPS